MDNELLQNHLRRQLITEMRAQFSLLLANWTWNIKQDPALQMTRVTRTHGISMAFFSNFSLKIRAFPLQDLHSDFCIANLNDTSQFHPVS